MPLYDQPPGLPRLLHKAYSCVTDKQPTVSSVGVSSMQLESIRQARLPTCRVSN